jgi:hypothetical protein
MALPVTLTAGADSLGLRSNHLKSIIFGLLLASISAKSAEAADAATKTGYESCANAALMYASLVADTKKFSSEQQFHAVLDPTVSESLSPENQAYLRSLITAAWINRDKRIATEGMKIYRACVADLST